MKKIVFLLLVSFSVFSQTGIGTTTPDASAKLEVSATNKGFLPPRITLTSGTDNTTIPSPATGLLVYNTGNNAGLVAGYYYWNGTSWATIATASGSGVSASILRGSRSAAQTGLTNGGNVIFTQVDNVAGQEMSLNTSTGQITLAAGRTYRLMAQVPNYQTSAAETRTQFAWYNETAGTYFGSSSNAYTPSSGASYGATGGLSEAIITTTTSTVVSYRISQLSNTNQLGGSADFTSNGAYPWFEAQVISGNVPFNQFNYGDVKTGFQTGDHNGWVKLDGRQKSTLSSSQQAQATALGIGPNLPNADNAFLVQNANQLGTVAGSNTITLAQNQLPNVIYTGQIANLAHGAVIGASASGVFTRVNGSSYGNAGGGGGTETFNLNIPLNGGVT